MAQNSRCKNCGGEVVFKPEKGALVCDRCGSVFPIKQSRRSVMRREYSPTYVPEKNQDEYVNYACTTCGAKSVVGADTDITRCASCGNTTLKKHKTASVVPDGIIPFGISRSKAGEIFRNWVASRKFAPKDLKQMARLEKITGLYTPVWSLNYTTTLIYNAIGVRKSVDKDFIEHVNRYPVHKVEDNMHENVLKTASTRISDSVIRGLGDYDFNKLGPYSTEYLMGFAGIDTDVDLHSVYNDLVREESSNNEWRVRSALNSQYDYIDALNCRTTFRDVTFSYTYLPVWANHYTYNGKEYHCYINGQTGKATGSSPKSAGKILGLVGGILAGILAGIGILAAVISYVI